MVCGSSVEFLTHNMYRRCVIVDFIKYYYSLKEATDVIKYVFLNALNFVRGDWIKFFFFFFNFFIHLSLELVGEKKQKEQAKIQFESKVRTPNQDLKISGQNQTDSRFKDLLEEDSEA